MFDNNIDFYLAQEDFNKWNPPETRKHRDAFDIFDNEDEEYDAYMDRRLEE